MSIMTHSLDCHSCGAPIALHSLHSPIINCPYCNKSVQVPKDLLPYLSTGKVLLRADFNDPNLPGWEKVNPECQSLVLGPQPEFQSRFPSSGRVHFALKSSGYFEDQDASVTMRFLEGDTTYIRAGLFLRYQDGIGGYGILVSAQSTYLIGYYETPPGEKMAWKTKLNWTTHTALLPGLNQSNRLRVVAQGNRFKVYLNGVMATSIKDDLYQEGQIRLAVEPSDKSDIRIAFSTLEIREPA